MTKMEYDVRRNEMIEKTQIDKILENAAKTFSTEGKESIIIRIPNMSDVFFQELKRIAYDEWTFDVEKKLLGRVKIFNGIVYQYPF